MFCAVCSAFSPPACVGSVCECALTECETMFYCPCTNWSGLCREPVFVAAGSGCNGHTTHRIGVYKSISITLPESRCTYPTENNGFPAHPSAVERKKHTEDNMFAPTPEREMNGCDTRPFQPDSRRRGCAPQLRRESTPSFSQDNTPYYGCQSMYRFSREGAKKPLPWYAPPQRSSLMSASPSQRKTSMKIQPRNLQTAVYEIDERQKTQHQNLRQIVDSSNRTPVCLLL